MSPDTVADSSGVLTVARGLQVLRAFRSERAPLSNAELVRRTGLSKATVSRLTSTLLQLGFLRHVPGGRAFELGAASLGIGHAFVSSSEMLQRAYPVMQEAANRLNVSCAMAVPQGTDMLYVGYRASHRVATLRLGVGSVLPMATTAIGHAYLWGLPASEQRALLARIRKASGPQEAAVLEGIQRSFANLEAGGSCGVRDGFLRDTFGIAIPVRLGRDGILVSMSCGRADLHADVDREREQITPHLRKTAAEIQALLADLEGEP